MAHPVPGLEHISAASIRQITRDGRRIVVGIAPPGGSAYTLVLDTGTGATLFDSRDVQSTTRTYGSAMLSPDGLMLADSAHDSMSIVRIRTLLTGVEHEAFRDPMSDVEVQAVSEGAASVAGFSNVGVTAGPVVVVGGPAAPVKAFHGVCRPAALITCAREPVTMSADGRYLAYRYTGVLSTGQPHHHGILLADAEAGTVQLLPASHPDLAPGNWTLESSTARISGDGRWVGVTAPHRETNTPRATLIRRDTGLADLVAPSLGPTILHDVSDDARFVLITREHAPASGQPLIVVDRVSGLMSQVIDPLDTPLGTSRILTAHLSGDGSTIVATLGDGATTDTTPRRTLIVHLDTDGDGMHDAWESTFG